MACEISKGATSEASPTLYNSTDNGRWAVGPREPQGSFPPPHLSRLSCRSDVRLESRPKSKSGGNHHLCWQDGRARSSGPPRLLGAHSGLMQLHPQLQSVV